MTLFGKGWLDFGKGWLDCRSYSPIYFGLGILWALAQNERAEGIAMNTTEDITTEDIVGMFDDLVECAPNPWTNCPGVCNRLADVVYQLSRSGVVNPVKAARVIAALTDEDKVTDFDEWEQWCPLKNKVAFSENWQRWHYDDGEWFYCDGASWWSHRPVALSS